MYDKFADTSNCPSQRCKTVPTPSRLNPNGKHEGYLEVHGFDNPTSAEVSKWQCCADVSLHLIRYAGYDRCVYDYFEDMEVAAWHVRKKGLDTLSV